MKQSTTVFTVALGILFALLGAYLVFLAVTNDRGQLNNLALGIVGLCMGAGFATASLTWRLAAYPDRLELYQFGFRKWSILAADIGVAEGQSSVAPTVIIANAKTGKVRANLNMLAFNLAEFEAFSLYVDSTRAAKGIALEEPEPVEEQTWVEILTPLLMLPPLLLILAFGSLGFAIWRGTLSSAEIVRRGEWGAGAPLALFAVIAMAIWLLKRREKPEIDKTK